MELLPTILRTQVILPATTGVPAGEKPVVWFSSRQDWEPSAAKGIIEDGRNHTLTFDEMVSFGIARIGVDQSAAPYNWQQLCKRARIARRKDLEGAGIAMGSNPAYWYGVLKPVVLAKWQAIQKYADGEWIDL